MIVQGTNNPLVIQFDQDVSEMASLIITMWSLSGTMVKKWETEDMTIENDTAICPLTETESKEFPGTVVTIEAKGLDSEGAAVFWDRMDVKMVRRHDKDIPLEEDEDDGEEVEDSEVS